MVATFIAMLISGLWHGAGWTFIIYGVLHGLGLVINHNWKKRKKKLPQILAWFLTFNFINVSMIFFRAKNIENAIKILRGMCGLEGIIIPKIGIKSIGLLKNFDVKIGSYLYPEDYLMILYIVASFYIIHKLKNSMELEKEVKLNERIGILCGFSFIICILGLNKITEFIYFNF
jgi:D-alanyl-lipoteichoic acid acyltransferase DltB (MBOAT superfamily)